MEASQCSGALAPRKKKLAAEYVISYVCYVKMSSIHNEQLTLCIAVEKEDSVSVSLRVLHTRVERVDSV